MLRFCEKHKRIVSTRKVSQTNGRCLVCEHSFILESTTKKDLRFPIKKAIEKYKRIGGGANNCDRRKL